MNIKLDGLALSQIDRRLDSLRVVKDKSSISGGWIKYIRKAMGMTLKDLSHLVGLSLATVAQAERREIEGKLTLSTLRKLATAMECELVYSFIPKKSITDTIKNKAREKARERLIEAGLHMKLEAQDVDENIDERVERLAMKFIKDGNVW